MERKRLLTPEGGCALLCLAYIACMLGSGIINILYSLEAGGVGLGQAVAASAVTLALYAAGSALTLRFPSPELSGFGVGYWGVTVAGFVFYAAFNLYNVPVSIPIPYMTAFLRFVMLLVTLPLLAFNAIISALPSLWMRTVFALALPVAAFALSLSVRLRFRRKKSRPVRGRPEDGDDGES